MAAPSTKPLHPKRPFTATKHIPAAMNIDSPAYDASEEDNDPLTDSGASIVSRSSFSSNTSIRPPSTATSASTGAGTGAAIRARGTSTSTTVPLSRTGAARGPVGIVGTSAGRHLAQLSGISSDVDVEVDSGVDSPTYDGDIESSTTAGPDDRVHLPTSQSSSSYVHTHAHHPPSTFLSSPSTAASTGPTYSHGARSHREQPQQQQPSVLSSTTSSSLRHAPNPSTSPTKRSLVSPPSPSSNTLPKPPSNSHPHSLPKSSPSPPALHRPTPMHPSRPTEPIPAGISTAAFDPAKLTPEDVQLWFREMIDGPGCTVGDKTYKINEPPTERPVRIYADGVYDLFHFGHALQLRQSKLAFPSVPPIREAMTAGTQDATQGLDRERADGRGAGVDGEERDAEEWTPGVYLLVGVNSDEQCEEHKNRTVMTHAERCEAVRHCRWVDEVVPEAPWVIDGPFIEKYKIDYVAHDVDPYGSAGLDDVYAFCKLQGKFLPTRRTPGISTSDLLARLVSGYRHRVFDKKLAKMGMHALMAEGSDWDESASVSRAESRDVSRRVSRVGSPSLEKES